jgi:hypothetical protein
LLYRRNRRRAVMFITGEVGGKYKIEKDRLESHFREWGMARPCDRVPVQMGKFTIAEVAERLKKCENTALGENQLTYRHWKRVDPDSSVLASAFNICLKYRKVPSVWMESKRERPTIIGGR